MNGIPKNTWHLPDDLDKSKLSYNYVDYTVFDQGEEVTLQQAKKILADIDAGNLKVDFRMRELLKKISNKSSSL